jgi:hypothetical protein
MIKTQICPSAVYDRTKLAQIIRSGTKYSALFLLAFQAATVQSACDSIQEAFNKRKNKSSSQFDVWQWDFTKNPSEVVTDHHKYWKTKGKIPKGSYNNNPQYEVNKDSCEWKQIAERWNTTDTVNPSRITKIYRVENNALYKNWMARRRIVSAELLFCDQCGKAPINTRKNDKRFLRKIANPSCNCGGSYVVKDANVGSFWHGCPEHVVDDVTKGSSKDKVRVAHGKYKDNVHVGFDPSVGKTQLYGKGAYFAKENSYSIDCNYAKGNQIILANIICGATVSGSNGDEHPRNKSKYAHTFVPGDLMIVVPESNLIYPAYIVHYEPIPAEPIIPFPKEASFPDTVAVRIRLAEDSANWNQTLENGVLSDRRIQMWDRDSQKDGLHYEHYVQRTLFPLREERRGVNSATRETVQRQLIAFRDLWIPGAADRELAPHPCTAKCGGAPACWRCAILDTKN